MKVKITKYLKIFRTLIPMIMLIVTLLYAYLLNGNLQTTYYNVKFEGVKDSIQSLVSSLESVNKYNEETVASMDQILKESLLYIDNKSAVVLRLVDDQFNDVIKDTTISEVFDLNEQERQVFKMQRETNTQGQFRTDSNPKYREIYWQEITVTGQKYYCIASVNEFEVNTLFDLNQFKLYIILLSAISVISIYDSIWLRCKMNNKGGKV